MGVPRCRICARPGFLYGTRDPETGWTGWCTICCWRWRFHAPKMLADFRIFDGMLAPEIKWTLMLYLIGKELTERVKGGEWLSDLRKIKIRAVREVWRRYLLGKNPPIIDEYTGQDRLANTDDELDDGLWDVDLNYRNKLWKLQLARTHCDGYHSRPLTAVICMIGCPPSCRCGLHSMGSGVFSS